MKDSWSVEIDNFDTFLEEAIRNCGEAAIEKLDGICIHRRDSSCDADRRDHG